MRVIPAYSNGKIQYVEVEEKPFQFYDDYYMKEKVYGIPACESGVYPIWERVANRISSDERVLDLGCGTGQFSQVLLNQGKKFVLGVDFSPVAIDKAKSMLPFARFEVGDLYKSDTYERVEYDCVTLCEVLEHLEYDLAVMGHIKGGAHIVFTVPNFLTVEGSHVRGFRNQGEIVSRYAKFMRFYDMKEYVTDKVEDNKIFIVDGIKKDGN